MKKIIPFFCFVASMLPIAIGTAFAQNKTTDSLQAVSIALHCSIAGTTSS